jgi:hypothetical protein
MTNDKPKKPNISAPTSNRITVAFPFSNIKIQEPTEQVRALADLVVELSERLAKVDPSVETDMLVQRAHTIAGQLG